MDGRTNESPCLTLRRLAVSVKFFLEMALVKTRRKWGTYYKIYRSIKRKHIGRYIGTIAGQPYGRNGTVHIIRTDDAEGIYSYWSQRFARKRLHRHEGDCYRLTKEDIQAFKSRSVM